jgi:hypothetical protein
MTARRIIITRDIIVKELSHDFPFTADQIIAALQRAGWVIVKARRARKRGKRCQEHWNWCREYIDRQAMYRVDENHPPIPSKKPGGTYARQFYLRRATFSRILHTAWAYSN